MILVTEATLGEEMTLYQCFHIPGKTNQPYPEEAIFFSFKMLMNIATSR